MNGSENRPRPERKWFPAWSGSREERVAKRAIVAARVHKVEKALGDTTVHRSLCGRARLFRWECATAYRQSRILPQERTTPPGRFEAVLAKNLAGKIILWVDYEQGISLHTLRSVDAKERRLERSLSSTATDNRISYGCIKLSVEFWRDTVLPAFKDTVGFVDVMPEASPLGTVFPMGTHTP